ncbi:MAG: GntR family transcriptional regulator [Pseudomonadota bacterium]
MAARKPGRRQQNLSLEVAKHLRDKIDSGDLPPGSRVNEVHLSKAMGVSRTPLREALSRLASEGAVRSEPRRGFFVRPLTLEEFEALCPALAVLAVEALQLSESPNLGMLYQLDALNLDISQTDSPAQRVEQQELWLRMLLSNCSNLVILELIGDVSRRMRRYQRAYFHAVDPSNEKDQGRAMIAEALRQDDLAESSRLLKQHLATGTPGLAAWLSASMGLETGASDRLQNSES